MDVPILKPIRLGTFKTYPSFSLTYSFVNGTPQHKRRADCESACCQHNVVKNFAKWCSLLPFSTEVNYMHICIPTTYQLCYLEKSFLVVLFVFKTVATVTFFSVSVAVCLGAWILEEGKWHPRQHCCRSPEMEKFFRNATETEFPGKVPVVWRVVLCFWPCITSQSSYLIFLVLFIVVQ